MKPYIKAILFLVVVYFCDFLFRKGLVGHFLPFQLPYNLNILILFTLFAIVAWFITKRFAKSDQMEMSDLGISWSKLNQKEFLIGFLVGVILWGIVSMSQSLLAGFSWVVRPDVAILSLLHGLFFIFIADLGTELFTRGYPITKFKESFGAKAAIIIMVLFVILKSFSFEQTGVLLFYSILIPALHTIFFSIIYFKTSRLGASLAIHTGANFVTISIFDLRVEQESQAIPAGIFEANTSLENLSIHALQLPWVVMAALFSIATYIWWMKKAS